MPDITHPEYFLQLARTLDRMTADLPAAGQLQRGDDITPAIQKLIGDASCVLMEISEELTTSYRDEVLHRPSHGPVERFGTAALAQSAVPLGMALSHLGHVTERLGFLHGHLLQPAVGKRIPIPLDARQPLQERLDLVAPLLRTAAQQLRTNAAELSRIHAARSRTSPAPAMPAEARPARVMR
ncbi:hypothetical protein [Streptomyces orinoci]|uniref:Uncharacterized protein n=1 Tax=Streptomyces orinoci TaxID=67339 RepID=A0ABV3JUK5_STRON|nr:hypothetical protein [Streptomyces orinoci]